MEKLQFKLKDLLVQIDEIQDEVDGETVLTLISHGDLGVMGYLMLKGQDEYARWEWQVCEPEAIATMAGAELLLWDAAKRLHQAMGDMEELIAERNGL